MLGYLAIKAIIRLLQTKGVCLVLKALTVLTQRMQLPPIVLLDLFRTKAKRHALLVWIIFSQQLVVPIARQCLLDSILILVILHPVRKELTRNGVKLLVALVQMVFYVLNKLKTEKIFDFHALEAATVAEECKLCVHLVILV